MLSRAFTLPGLFIRLWFGAISNPVLKTDSINTSAEKSSKLLVDKWSYCRLPSVFCSGVPVGVETLRSLSLRNTFPIQFTQNTKRPVTKLRTFRHESAPASFSDCAASFSIQEVRPDCRLPVFSYVLLVVSLAFYSFLRTRLFTGCSTENVVRNVWYEAIRQARKGRYE